MILFSGFLAVAAFCYAGSCWNSFRYYQSLDEAADVRAVRWFTVAFFIQGTALLGKGLADGTAPLTSLQGILSVLSFCLALALWLGRFKTRVPVLTSLFLPFIFFLSLVAFGDSISGRQLMDRHLMTALLSWHIFLTFLGFSFYTLGFGVAVAFWVQEGQLKQRRMKRWSYRLPALEILDNLTVFYITSGFFFWLGGFGLGSLQAFQVWHRLPFDDPKIMGSFLVLLIYAFFFLLRWGLRMRGRKSMALVMAGYFLALFTFAGVRFFLTTQHTF